MITRASFRGRRERDTPGTHRVQPRLKPSLCFVVPNGYAVLSGRKDLQHIGGAEVQQSLIAKELAARGYRVSFITLDHGQPDGIEHDGVRVYKMCARNAGIRGLRFVHPRWTSLWAALGRAGAEVCFQRNTGAETGQVSLWCRWHQRDFVFVVASDTDCEKHLPYLRTRRERILYRYGLKHASKVIAQTTTQVEMLRRSFGVDATLIRSCTGKPKIVPTCLDDRPPSGRPRVLWIGRMAREKRPEMLLELAAVCPEFDFEVIGDSTDGGDYSANVRGRAAGLQNVRLVGRVPHDKMDQHYRGATVLLCTSAWEGYPNTFMEAWARGIPTVSTVDPDNVIASNGLGAVASSISSFRQVLNGYVLSPNMWRATSHRARQFFEQNHTVTGTVDAYMPVFAQLKQSHENVICL